jgi:predicted enzyme related to lactoylglutathione lyase
VNDPNSFVWPELITPDVDTAKKFYGDLFDWKNEAFDMEGGLQYTTFSLQGVENAMGGLMAPPMEGMPPFWGVYFAVADCDATVEKAKKLGATLVNGPMDIPDVGRSATLSDPQGAMFNVMKMANPQK